MPPFILVMMRGQEFCCLAPPFTCLRCPYCRATIATGKVSDACWPHASTVAVTRAVFVGFFGVNMKLSLLSTLWNSGVREDLDTASIEGVTANYSGALVWMARVKSCEL